MEALIGIGPKDALSQANKLSRTYAVLLEALNRHVARVSKGHRRSRSMCMIVCLLNDLERPSILRCGNSRISLAVMSRLETRTAAALT